MYYIILHFILLLLSFKNNIQINRIICCDDEKTNLYHSS